MVPGFGRGDTWCQNSRLQNPESRCPLCKSPQVRGTCFSIWSGQTPFAPSHARSLALALALSLSHSLSLSLSLSLFFVCDGQLLLGSVDGKCSTNPKAAFHPLIICAFMLSHFSPVWLFCNPMACSPPSSSVHGILQNTGVGCHPWCRIKFMLHKAQRKCFLYRIMGNF